MKKTLLLLAVMTAGSIYAEAPAKAPASASAPAAVAPAPSAAPAAVAPAPAAAPAAMAPAPAAAPAAVAPAPAKDEEPGIVICLARGLCNISTGWLELPRCVIYDNDVIPVFGLIVGIPEGALFMVGRTLCGVYDILTFGTSGNTFHGKRFPATIFQSKWRFHDK